MRVQYVTAAGFLDLIYFFAFACVCVCVSVCVSVCLDIPVYAISPLFQKGSSDVSPHTTLSFSRWLKSGTETFGQKQREKQLFVGNFNYKNKDLFKLDKIFWVAYNL